MTKIELEGFQAYKQGYPITANPYSRIDTAIRQSWFDGWNLAATYSAEQDEWYAEGGQ